MEIIKIFKLKRYGDKNYILYKTNTSNNVFLGEIEKKDDNCNIIKPNMEMLKILQVIIKNMITKEHLEEFKIYQYEEVDKSLFSNFSISSSQNISLDSEKIIIMKNFNYEKPIEEKKIIVKEEVKKEKNSKLPFIIIGLLLLITIITTLILNDNKKSASETLGDFIDSLEFLKGIAPIIVHIIITILAFCGREKTFGQGFKKISIFLLIFTLLQIVITKNFHIEIIASIFIVGYAMYISYYIAKRISSSILDRSGSDSLILFYILFWFLFGLFSGIINGAFYMVFEMWVISIIK